MCIRDSSITGKNDGDTLAQWDDSSGNGNHLTQVVGVVQPVYKINRINGLPAVNFGNIAASSYFDLPRFFSAFTSGEIIFVIRSNNSSGSPGWNSIGGSNESDYYNNVGDIFSSFAISVRLSTGAIAPAGILLKWNIVIISFTGGVWEVFLNGTLVCSFAGKNSGWAAVGNSFIGRSSNVNSWYFYGDMAEIIFYSTVSTGAKRTQILTYLANKYGAFPTP